MNKKQAGTLARIFEMPTPHLQITWTEVVSLIGAIDGKIVEKQGSRVRIVIGELMVAIHKPHPHKELKSYQVKLIREALETEGITP